jgi:large subunit ribosomal protein L9
MKVILTEDVGHLGQAGDAVRVSDGYARNYLIPKALALEATKSNLAVYKERLKQNKVVANKAKRSAEALAAELGKISCTAVVQVGEDDRVFGAVTSQTVAQLLARQGYDIDRRHILLDDPIKALGVYAVGIKLHADVEAKVKVWVVKEE